LLAARDGRGEVKGEHMKNFGRMIGALSSAGLLGATLTLAAGAGAGTVANAAPAIVHAPRIPGPGVGNGLHSTWSASNWSGYAETGSFAGVSGTWTVPSVAASSSPTYSSAWIGVDGFANSSLIQTGTEEDYYSGAAHYNAWWEILPAPETALPSGHSVNPGDTMTASIYETTAPTAAPPVHGRSHGGGGGGTSQGQWVITISDTTPGHAWTFSTTQSYNGAGASAEWIMEAPQIGGRIGTLAHYTITPATAGAGDFDNAGILKSAVVSGSTPSYTPAGLNYQADSGVMIQNRVQVSTPGNPDSALNAFNVAYGSALPATPSS
jgi:hypothetical protein